MKSNSPVIVRLTHTEAKWLENLCKEARDDAINVIQDACASGGIAELLKLRAENMESLGNKINNAAHKAACN